MKFSIFIKTFAIIFLSLQLITICFPSHLNWGFHFLSFQSDFFIAFYTLVAIVLLFDSFRERVLKSLNKFLKKLNNKKPLHFLIVIFIFVLISIFFPVKTHLLGDGALLLREISNIWMTDEIPPAFNHQFLVGLTINFMKYIVHIQSLEAAEKFYRYYDFAAGVILILLVFYLMSKIQIKPIEKLLLGILLFYTTGVQLFIGYVENYALLYTSIFAFVITGWFSMENKISIIIPVLIFLLAIGFHISSIVFVPAILYLLYEKIKTKKNLVWIILSTITFLFLIIIMFFRDRFSYFLNQAILESRWSLLPITHTDNYYAYSMFSIYHFIDWLNANLLFAPFGLIIVIGTFLFYRMQVSFKNPVIIFLLLTSFLGLMFTFVTHFALGMARDWDFMSSFFIPLTFLSAYLLLQINQTNSTNNILVLIVGITMLHTTSWILVNANENTAVNRVNLLNNTKLLGRVPQLNYYETLGSYYYWRNDYTKAKEYFEKYIQVEATNPRILGNLAAIYTKLKDNENTFRILKKAADAQSPNPGIYINLGVEYSRRGDTSSALRCYQKALQLDSTRSKAYANMASLFMNQKKYDLAKENYLKALKFGLNDPIIFRELGFVFYYLQDYKNSAKYFDFYLHYKPDDENAKFMRDNLLLLIKTLENQ